MTRQWTAQSGGQHRQRGASAVEFALVFPVLFVLFYGMLSYGLIFLVRLGLQHSAEEGARAALVYQEIDATGLTLEEQFQVQLASRISAAQAVALSSVSWMTRWTTPQVTAVICPIATMGGSDCSDFEGTVTSCGLHLDSGCQMVVTVFYNYAANPVVPALPGFGLLVPTSLLGQARVLMDGRALAI